MKCGIKNSIVLFAGAAMAMFVCLSAYAGQDVDDASDYGLLPRYKGYHIVEYERNTDAFDFWTGQDKKPSVQGEKYFIHYAIDENVPVPGKDTLAGYIIRKVKKIGGTVVYQGDSEVTGNTMTLRLPRGNTDIWISFVPVGRGEEYTLTIVEHEMSPREIHPSSVPPIPEKRQ